MRHKTKIVNDEKDNQIKCELTNLFTKPTYENVIKASNEFIQIIGEINEEDIYKIRLL